MVAVPAILNGSQNTYFDNLGATRDRIFLLYAQQQYNLDLSSFYIHYR